MLPIGAAFVSALTLTGDYAGHRLSHMVRGRAVLVAVLGIACRGATEPFRSPYSYITATVSTTAQVRDTVVHIMTVTLHNPDVPTSAWAALINGHST